MKLGFVLLLLAVPLAVAGAGHALLYKRDPRSSLGWIGLCLLLPIVGPLLYFLFGLNRIRTRARELARVDQDVNVAKDESWSCEAVQAMGQPLQEIVRVSDKVASHALLGGNQATLLVDGTQAYPRMLTAIDKAQVSVYLSTYIFKVDAVGREFVAALARAVARGVRVRVLVDGVGQWYGLRRIEAYLRREHVRMATFLPPQLLPPRAQINLRNHRKILLIDATVGFSGGLNIDSGHVGTAEEVAKVRDIHFALAGPILSQLEQVFREDWLFASGEELPPSMAPLPVGKMLCRVVADGPNRHLDSLLLILLGAISAASDRVVIVTPYFVPSREMVGALQAAALRGVEVVIILPETNNMPIVHYATRNLLWELLRHGVRAYYQSGGFVHSKLFLVDKHYVMLGSANVDPRSLRLNFEVMVEVIDKNFAAKTSDQIESYLTSAREITLEEVDARSRLVRTRDSLAWLASPYL